MSVIQEESEQKGSTVKKHRGLPFSSKKNTNGISPFIVPKLREAGSPIRPFRQRKINSHEFNYTAGTFESPCNVSQEV